MLRGRRRSVRGRLTVAAALPAVLLLALVGGCTGGRASGAGPEASASDSGSPTSVSSGPVTLRFAVYGDAGERRAYRTLARAYTRAHPQVTVEVSASSGFAGASRRLDRQLAAGRGPDVFVTDATAMPALQAAGRLQPVDELLEQRGISFGDSYERLGLEAMAADSALQCMPSDVSPYVVYYNPTLVSPLRSGRPGERTPSSLTGWTWDQFVRTARRASGNGVKGLYLPPSLSTLTPLMRSAGTDVVDDPSRPTTLTLSSSASVAALTRILTVARNARIAPTPAELAQQDAVGRFEDGRLGMLIGTRALVPRLRHHLGLSFDVFPLPSLGVSATVADVEGYCLNRASGQTAAAADFLAFAVGNRGSAITTRSGAVMPANLAVQRSRAFLQPDHQPADANVFVAVMRRASTLPNPTAWAAVVRAEQPYLDRLFYAEVPDLAATLPRMDAVSAALLAPPSPSSTPSSTPSGTPSSDAPTSPSGAAGATGVPGGTSTGPASVPTPAISPAPAHVSGSPAR